ncbi:MAG TPA: hypothetical protein DDY91_02625 [Planctomycetaceae bacterium]|nr:hypothetical protein [Planctomycetaceae bacterium]
MTGNRSGGQSEKSKVKRTRKDIETARLKPSPENQILYNSRGPDHPDLRGLIESIRERGIEARLLVSRDHYIISGHNRLQAAQHLGLETVPVEILPIRRADCSSDEWARLLREHNHGRQKTFDELTREKLVDISKDEVLRAARDQRKLRSDGETEEIEISATRKQRSVISDDKRPMADAVRKVLRELGTDLPISVRGLHYALLRQPPLRNSRKPNSRYRNDRQSYQDLSDLLTRMRLAGEVPWGWIIDETRPAIHWQTWPNSAEFIGQKSKLLFDGYARDLMQSQRVFFAVVCEKLSVKRFLESTCAEFTIPLIVARGNSSADLRHQLAARYHASRKDACHLFILADCDPDGDSIAQTLVNSLAHEFDIDELTADRVAITHRQADEMGLPYNLDAKPSSSNYEGFIERHGRSDCYELEAVQPAQLRTWLDEAIRGRIDLESYNAEVEQQAEELRFIEAKKRAVLELVLSAPTSLEADGSSAP